VLTTNAADVTAIAATFDTDFTTAAAGRAPAGTASQRLVWSPDARATFLQRNDGAVRTLEITTEELKFFGGFQRVAQSTWPYPPSQPGSDVPDAAWLEPHRGLVGAVQRLSGVQIRCVLPCPIWHATATWPIGEQFDWPVYPIIALIALIGVIGRAGVRLGVGRGRSPVSSW
jgi:hypothetical protein